MLHIEELKPCIEKATRHLDASSKEWIVVANDGKISLFQRKNMQLNPITPNCDCAKDHLDLEHVEPYLESAVYCGKFEKLILVGSAESVEKVKNSFGEVLRSRIKAEIIQQEGLDDSSSIAERLKGA